MISILDESETENMMTNLPLVYGAKYFITKNLAVKNGLVNGTEVELHSICLDYDVLIQKDTKGEIILNEMPKYLLVKKLNSITTNPLRFDHLEEELIPFFTETSSFSVKPKLDVLGTISVTVSRTNFPLTPAYALTAYKAQGKTMSKVIIDLKKPPTGKVDFAYAYVALSRAKCLNDILILRDFDMNALSPKIPIDYFIENERLKELSKKM